MRVALGTMLERFMAVSNVVEKVNLIFASKECCSDRVDRCVSPSFIVETSGFVEMLKVVHVGLRSPKVEITNLKVGPDWCERDRRVDSQ